MPCPTAIHDPTRVTAMQTANTRPSLRLQYRIVCSVPFQRADVHPATYLHSINLTALWHTTPCCQFCGHANALLEGRASGQNGNATFSPAFAPSRLFTRCRTQHQLSKQPYTLSPYTLVRLDPTWHWPPARAYSSCLHNSGLRNAWL